MSESKALDLQYPAPEAAFGARVRRAWSSPCLQSADIKTLTAARNNSGTDFLGRIPWFPGTPFKGR